jgi:hypothetical protein
MIDIKHSYTTNQVVSALMQANPSKKQTEAVSIRKWNEYLALVSQQIQKSIILARTDQIDSNQLPFAWTELNKSLGECRAFGDYLTWFHQHFPIVRVLRKGTPGTLTMTELLYDIELGSMSQTPQEAYATMYGLQLSLSDVDIDWVNIDMRSLSAFISANAEALRTSTKTNHQQALKRNGIWARSILLCAEYFHSQGQGYRIAQIANESNFGRRYYRSLNLQSAPKIVRHAALGSCYQYDLNASVFAWRYNFVKFIDSKISMPYTLEYIDEKDQRRRQLALALDIPVSFNIKLEIIKELITAIGFGSRPGNNGVRWQDQSGAWQYPSINKIIKSPEARDNLLAHPWLAGFILEQKMISKVIFDNIKELVRDKEFLANERGNLSVNATLAYAYQTEERNCIDMLSEQARLDGTFLLAVHDAFYTSRPVKLVELKEQLVAFNPYATISKEHHNSYGYDHEEQQHEKRMLEEEKRANGGVVPKKVLVNQNRIQRLVEQHLKEYTGDDEFNNGFRIESNYDTMHDPFYMQD